MAVAATPATDLALRTDRDRAMVFGGLRRMEMLGLRLGDVQTGSRRLFIAEGEGGRQRIVPIAPRFFTTLGMPTGQPETRTEKVFVVVKGGRRGQPLPAAGLDEILDGAGV